MGLKKEYLEFLRNQKESEKSGFSGLLLGSAKGLTKNHYLDYLMPHLK